MSCINSRSRQLSICETITYMSSQLVSGWNKAKPVSNQLLRGWNKAKPVSKQLLSGWNKAKLGLKLK